jgi:hypothetical protein
MIIHIVLKIYIYLPLPFIEWLIWWFSINNMSVDLYFLNIHLTLQLVFITNDD